MSKIKKVLCFILIGAMSIVMVSGISFAKVKSSKRSSATLSNSHKNISLDISNCNISIEKSNDTQFHFDYNRDIFEVTSKDMNGTISISAKLKSGASAQLFDFVTIYIPDVNYGTVTVKGIKAGIGLIDFNANINIDVDSSSVGCYIPQGFTKNITFKAVKSSGKIVFNSLAKDYTLHITKSNCSVSADSYFPKIDSSATNYNYVNGKGTARINVDIKDSAFSVKRDLE